MLNFIMGQLWQSSWQAAVVAIFVILLQFLFGRLLTPAGGMAYGSLYLFAC